MCFVSLFFSFFFPETKPRLTGHHTPPRTCCCFSFFRPRRFVLFACPGHACFCSACFFGVPFWAHTRDSWILSGMRAPKAFFKREKETEQRESLNLKCVCCFSRFGASHVSSGPCPSKQDRLLGPCGQKRTLEAKRNQTSEGGRLSPFSPEKGQSRPPSLLFGFFLLLVFVFGHTGPRACLFAGATVVSPQGSHMHFFPQVLLSLSLCLFLSLDWPSWPASPGSAIARVCGNRTRQKKQYGQESQKLSGRLRCGFSI